MTILKSFSPTCFRSKEIQIDTSMWYGCFYHAQNGELKRIVSHGCPRWTTRINRKIVHFQTRLSLEKFNGIDLSLLAAESKDGHWLDQLRHYSLGLVLPFPLMKHNRGKLLTCQYKLSEHVFLLKWGPWRVNVIFVFANHVLRMFWSTWRGKVKPITESKGLPKMLIF